MNLAVRDVRMHLGRFVGTSVGLGLLFSVVIAMQGIYAGMVDDATILTRALEADLWVVQRDTRGPFAEASRLDPSLEARIAAVPGVTRARAYTYQIVQREHRDRSLRLALVGVAWPGDRGETLPLVAGRGLSQAHGELVLDASLGLGIGERLELGGDEYRVVGLTRNALTSGGEAVAFLSVADAQLVGNELPDEAVQIERQRTLERLRRTDLGRSQPALEALPLDTRFRPPALPTPSIHAVLVNVRDSQHVAPVREVLADWGDVSVFSTDQQIELLLQGVVQRARLQIGLFTAILTLTAAVIVMMVIYNMMLEKTHDIAVLKLLGARASRLTGLVFQQAWLLGVLAYLIAFLIGELLYPSFPRRVVLTEQIRWGSPIAILVLNTLASGLGVWHASRIDASRVLEG